MNLEEATQEARRLTRGDTLLEVSSGYRESSHLCGAIVGSTHSVYINGEFGRGDSYAAAFEDWHKENRLARLQKRAMLEEQLKDMGDDL